MSSVIAERGAAGRGDAQARRRSWSRTPCCRCDPRRRRTAGARCRRAARTPAGRCSRRPPRRSRRGRAPGRSRQSKFGVAPQDRRVGPEREVDDVGAVRHRPVDTGGDVVGRARAVVAEHADTSTFAPGATPSTPTPLPVLAATIPATWVPWPSPSWGSSSSGRSRGPRSAGPGDPGARSTRRCR